MRRSVAGVLLLLAGCSPQMATTSTSLAEDAGDRPLVVDPVGIRPEPPMPVALRGCWDAIPPDDPDEPGGPHRMVITADTIELQFPGFQRQIGSADFVTRVGPRMIEGRFSAPGQRGPSTVATRLSLGDGLELPRDQLRRQEGDAGSTFYRRCREDAPRPNPPSGVERG